MKKTILIFLLTAILLSSTSTIIASEKGGTFFVNFGILGYDDFKFDPFFWYFGANIDLYINDNLFISPQVNLVMSDFQFADYLMEPAVLLNVKLGEFFIGGGFQKYIVISGGHGGSTDLALKLNAGFTGKNVRFTVFSRMEFDSLFKNMLIGVQFGIGF